MVSSANFEGYSQDLNVTLDRDSGAWRKAAHGRRIEFQKTVPVRVWWLNAYRGFTALLLVARFEIRAGGAQGCRG